MNDPHVARLQLHLLRAARVFEIGDRDDVARVVVDRAALRRAVAGDVEHHRAAGDAAPRPVIDAELRLVVARAQFLVGHAAPETVFVVADVREPVPLARRLCEEVVEAIVAVVADRDLAKHGMAELAAVEQRRIRLLLLPVHREYRPFAHQFGGGDDDVGRLQVEHADVVVRTKQAPGGFRRIAAHGGQFAVAGQLGGDVGHERVLQS